MFGNKATQEVSRTSFRNIKKIFKQRLLLPLGKRRALLKKNLNGKGITWWHPKMDLTYIQRLSS